MSIEEIDAYLNVRVCMLSIIMQHDTLMFVVCAAHASVLGGAESRPLYESIVGKTEVQCAAEEHAAVGGEFTQCDPHDNVWVSA